MIDNIETILEDLRECANHADRSHIILSEEAKILLAHIDKLQSQFGELARLRAAVPMLVQIAAEEQRYKCAARSSDGSWMQVTPCPDQEEVIAKWEAMAKESE